MKVKCRKISQIYVKRNIIEKESERRIRGLSDVTFTAAEGKLNFFVGRSGSGKTTLFDILSTKLSPTTGKVRLAGVNPYDLKIDELQTFRAKNIGYLHQRLEKNFLQQFSFIENVQILQDFGVNLNADRQTIDDYFKRLGLSERHKTTKLYLLSGGEKQRIALILMLLRDPQLLILDEPTSFLDLKNKMKVLKLLREFQEKDRTIFIATHDPELILKDSEIFFLDDGILRRDRVLYDISSTMLDSIVIQGEGGSKDHYVKLPALIYNNMKKNLHYYMEKIQEKPVVLKMKELDKEKAAERAVNKWIFVSDQEIEIPPKFRKFPWENGKYKWEVKEDELQVIFQDFNNEE